MASTLRRLCCSALIVRAIAATAPALAAPGDPMGTGIAAFDLVNSSKTDVATAVAVDGEGRIVVAGRVATGSDPGDEALAVARFLPTGVLDDSFDGDGKFVLDLGFEVGSRAAAVAALADGRVVVAGSYNLGGGDHDFLVVRLLESGALDLDFGGSGWGAYPFDRGGDNTDQATAMVIGPSGAIYLAGTIDAVQSGSSLAVVRLQENGTPDWKYPASSPTVGPFQTASAVALDPVGRIVVAGEYFDGATWNPALARLVGGGTIDGDFGLGGAMVLGLASEAAFRAVAVQPGGEIIAAGRAEDIPPSWLMIRFDRDAQDVLAQQTDDFESTGSQANAVLVQGDGKIVIAGTAFGAAGNDDFGITRIPADGYFADFPFGGGDGVATYDFNRGSGAHFDQVYAATFDRDGRIVVAGLSEWFGFDTDFAWVRFDSDSVFADGFEWQTARWSAKVP